MPAPIDNTFIDIVHNQLFDVWQRTTEDIADYENEIYEDEPIVTDMPQGMIVQYIPNGLLIWFGKQEDMNGEW